MIAMAIANRPRLLIADEPTNDLDPITQAQIFRLLSRMNQLGNTTILLVSHDLTTVTQWADRITVMYCGQSVESGSRKQLLQSPHHPYTEALLRAMPDFNLDVLPPINVSWKHYQALFLLCSTYLLVVALVRAAPMPQRKCVEVPKRRKIKNHKFSCHFPLNMEETNK